ncbi:MAG: hypothetical protein IJ087_11010 [Eggerthellaceae bacterium]|nr:hypothetical protein [Eggerthellaceae bacterium]
MPNTSHSPVTHYAGTGSKVGAYDKMRDMAAKGEAREFFEKHRGETEEQQAEAAYKHLLGKSAKPGKTGGATAPEAGGAMGKEAQKAALIKALNEKNGQAQAAAQPSQGAQAGNSPQAFVPFMLPATRVTKLKEAAECLKEIAKFADNDEALKPRRAPQPIAQETLEGYTDKRLESVNSSWDGHQESREVFEINACISALKEAEGWDVARDLIGRLEALKEADQAAQEVYSDNKRRAGAELSRRKAEREREKRKREYLKENYLEIIEALLTGADKSEIVATLENPPEASESVETRTIFADGSI